MTPDPIVVLPEDPEVRTRISSMLAALSELANDAEFRTQSATKNRLCLTATHGGSMQEVVIRNALSGSTTAFTGMSMIHRRSGRKVMTWDDETVHAASRHPLTRARTMHDHRPMIARWTSLWNAGATRDVPDEIPTEAGDALAFCARHLSACIAADGVAGLHTIHLTLAAGDMPLSVRIAAVKTHMQWRFVHDDLPRLSQALSDHLRPMLPMGWRFATEDHGRTLLSPLHVGYRIVEGLSPSEALRVLSDPTHADLPGTLRAR